MNRHEDRFDWWSLIFGVIYVLAGLMAFNNPLGGAVLVIYFIAFGIIFKGAVQLFLRRKVRQYTGIAINWLIVISIIDILIGIFLLFNATAGLLAIPYIFAFWFIFDSIVALISASRLRDYSKSRYWFVIVLSVIGIVVGIMLINNPLASIITIAMLIGFYFVINGIIFIVNAF